MAKRRLFSEITPLGHRVTLMRDRWREIIRFKHPALAGHEAAVRDCLRDPETVRQSEKDPSVHLYYRLTPTGYTCIVVGGPDPRARFVITAYFTKAIKKGHELWKK